MVSITPGSREWWPHIGLSGIFKLLSPDQRFAKPPRFRQRFLIKSPKGSSEADLMTMKSAWIETKRRPDLTLRRHHANGRLERRGAGATVELHDRLVAWLKQQG
jgi:hypothetical protein